MKAYRKPVVKRTDSLEAACEFCSLPGCYGLGSERNSHRPFKTRLGCRRRKNRVNHLYLEEIRREVNHERQPR